MDRVAERVFWGPIFRIDLTESEEENLMTLLDKLGRIFIPAEGDDKRVWAASKDVVFSVSSFFGVLSNTHNSHNWFDYLWKTKAPPRVLAFGWLALRGNILTMDNLRRHGVVLINACPLCLSAEETVDHLLLNCSFTQAIWTSTMDCFGCNWVFPRSILELFDAWKFGFQSKRGRLLWRSSFVANIWAVWKERNRRCFEDCSFPLVVVAMRARFLAASWVSVLPEF